MKKCETFEDLQALGTEKIHERTHISRDKVELILTKSYANIGKVQFMGFLSILEREFGVDLTEVRYEYTQFQNEHDSLFPKKESVILQPHSNAKQMWMIGGVLLIAVLVAGGYFFQTVISNEPNEEVITLSTAAVQVVEEPAEENLTETPEANTTLPAVENNATEPVQVSAKENVIADKDLRIHPTYKVWVGMIDTATGEKTQTITSEPIVIDTSKNWLIVLGHGRVEIESPAGKKLLKEKETVWFVYENGALTQLSKEEFVQRNGGKNW